MYIYIYKPNVYIYIYAPYTYIYTYLCGYLNKIYVHVHMVHGSGWLLAIVKQTGSLSALEDFDGRVRGFLQDVQVAIEPCGIGWFQVDS